jgi:hypothetical protein
MEYPFNGYLETRDFLGFFYLDVKLLIVSYLYLDDLCHWEYDFVLPKSFLVAKTLQEYKEEIYDPDKVHANTWKRTHEHLTRLKTRRAQVKHVSEHHFHLHPFDFPLFKPVWHRCFSPFAFAEIKDLRLGDMVRIQSPNSTKKTFLVECIDFTLALIDHTDNNLSIIPNTLLPIWTVPLHFWNPLQDIGFRTWLLHTPWHARVDTIHLQTFDTNIPIYSRIFVHNNVSYGALSITLNVDIMVRNDFPHYEWSSFFSPSFKHIMQQNCLSIIRIVMEKELYARLFG